MDFNGHGTHVSGIIAGKSKWFTGVAPEAKLRVYKVFSKAGWVTDDVLIDAFLAAYEDGVGAILHCPKAAQEEDMLTG
jgi:subtilisin family serine protease